MKQIKPTKNELALRRELFTGQLTATPAVHDVRPLPAQVEDEAKHTPGPWVTEWNTKLPDGTQANSIRNFGMFPRFICHCEGENRDANARLIASAPALLAALKTFLSIYPDSARLHPDIRIACTQARDAIAQAENF